MSELKKKASDESDKTVNVSDQAALRHLLADLWLQTRWQLGPDGQVKNGLYEPLEGPACLEVGAVAARAGWPSEDRAV